MMLNDNQEAKNNLQNSNRTVAIRNESSQRIFQPSFNPAAPEGLTRTRSGFTAAAKRGSIRLTGNRSSVDTKSTKPDFSMNLANFKKVGTKVRTSMMFAKALKGLKKNDETKAELSEDDSTEKEKAEEDGISNVLLGAKRRNYKQVDIDSLEQDELLELAISIFQKPSTYRSVNDIKMLVKSTEDVKFFQEISRENGKETHEQCVRFMFHKYLKKEDILFETGSIGTTFYVILKGKVGVWVKIPKETVHIRPDGTEERKTELVMTEVKIMSAGESFGELALMDNKPRAATIICKENSHFGVLDKQYFNRILKEKEMRKLALQIEFMASLKVFSNWSYNAVKSVYYACNLKEYRRGQTIFKEGDDVDGFYMIKSGEFKVQQIVEVERPKAAETDYFLKVNSSFLNPRTLPFDVAILMQGEIFGEEELVYPKKRTITVTCFSTVGSAYFLSKKEFNRRVLYEENSRVFLKNLIKSKTEWRNKRLDDFKSKTSKALIFPSKLKKLSEVSTAPEEGTRKNAPYHGYQEENTRGQSYHESVLMAPNLSFQQHAVSNLLEDLNLDFHEYSKDISMTTYDQVITNKKDVPSPTRKEKKTERKGLLSMYLQDKTLRDAMLENKKDKLKMKRQLGKTLVDEFISKEINTNNNDEINRSAKGESRTLISNIEANSQACHQEHENSGISNKSAGSPSMLPLTTRTMMLQDKIKSKLGEKFLESTIRSRLREKDEHSALKRNLSSEEHLKLKAYIKHEEIREFYKHDSFERRKRLKDLSEDSLTMKMKLKLREYKKQSGDSDRMSPPSHDISNLKATGRSRALLKPLANRAKPLSLDFDNILEMKKHDTTEGRNDYSSTRVTFSGTPKMHKDAPLDKNRMLKPNLELLPLKYKVGVVTEPKISITSPFRPKIRNMRNSVGHEVSSAPRQSTSFF